MDHEHFSAYQEASQAHSQRAQHEVASSSLPPIKLPTFPSASVSQFHTRRYSQQFNNANNSSLSSGLENSGGPVTSPTLGSSSFARQESKTVMSSSAAVPHQSGDQGASNLDDEIARSRAERSNRRNEVLSSTSSTSSDPRDTASARENIMALASRGTQPGDASGGGNSLASFMSGAAKPPPRHRVGTSMTEQEKEETEKLEREMEATRSKWKASNNAVEAGATASTSGVSLASLMKGNKADESSVKVGVASRWGQTIEKEGYGTGAPEGTRKRQVRDPPPAVSLAAMMGSKASGPRLNQPAPQAMGEEGPAHARRGFVGAYALPGMVAASSPGLRTKTNESVTSPAASTTSFRNGATTSPPIAQMATAAPPTSQDDFAPRADANKRSSVLDRWGRDAPTSSTQSAPALAKDPNASSSPVVSAEESGTNHGSNGISMGGKHTTHASFGSATDYARAGAPTPAFDSGSISAGETTSSRPSSPTSVRNVIAQWGQSAQPSQTAAALAAASIKESYGVRVADPRTSPQLSSRALPPRQPERAPAPVEFRRELPSLIQTQGRAAPVPSTPNTKPRFESSTPSYSSSFNLPPKPSTPQSLRDKRISVAKPAQSRADPKAVQAAVALALNTPVPTRLPEGEAVSTDVYSLLTQDPNPIDHNHMLYRTEILAIVHRQESPDSTTLFVWAGDEAPRVDSRVESRIGDIMKREGVQEVHRMNYRQETSALGEVFGDQITICKGFRDEFDHLATRLYSVQAVDDIAFIEEQDLTSRSICSGHCIVFSIVGEVYAWMGTHSIPLEQNACFDFAESIADGRQVTVLEEGKETAYFWHGLDGHEIASSYYWKFRPLLPPPVSVIAVETTSSIRRVEPIEFPKNTVVLVDGGFAEHWIVVPSSCKHKKAEVEVAIRAAEELAGKWKERGFGFKQAVHVLCAPSKLPVDLPHLARQLDFHQLNGDEQPMKMNVLTVEEARAQLL